MNLSDRMQEMLDKAPADWADFHQIAHFGPFGATAAALRDRNLVEFRISHEAGRDGFHRWQWRRIPETKDA